MRKGNCKDNMTKKFLVRKKISNIKKSKINSKRRILFLVIILFLILTLAFIIVFKINSLLKETLIINLEPQTLSIRTKNKDSLMLNFNVSLKQNLLCKSTCFYEFKDVSNNETLSFGTLNFKNSGKKHLSYELRINESGIGKKIYILELDCYNNNNSFCNSERSYRYKTSIIVLDYELLPEENFSKNYILSSIKNLEVDLNFIDFEHQKNSFVSNNLLKTISNNSFEYKKILESNIILEENYLELLNKILELNNFWSREDYLKAHETYSKIETITNFLKEYSFNVTKFNNDTLIKYNSAVKKLRSVQEEQELINNAYLFLQKTDENKSLQLKNLFSRTIDYIFYLKNGFYNSLDEIYNNVSKVESEISNMIKDYYEQSYSLNKKLYLNLLFANFTISEFFQTNISLDSNLEINNSQIMDYLCNKTIMINSILQEHNRKADELLFNNYSYLINSTLFEKNKNSIINNARINAYEKTRQKLLEMNISYSNEFIKNVSQNISSINFSNEFENITIEELKSITSFNLSEDFYDNLDFCLRTKEINVKELPKISFVLEELNITFSNYTKKLFFELKENPKKCCFQDSCECCYYGSCSKKYPIIFVHGHLAYEGNSPESSMNSFSRMQKAMLNYGYVPFNLDFKLHTYDENFDGFKLVPTIRASYYFISYYEVGTRIISIMKHESIENYAIRLKEIIDEVKLKTGSDKVIIIAHSMGGLVSREYLMLFGEESVDKLITIATPHKGISGKTLYFCKLIGSEKECEDMSKESIFMKKLNSYKPSLKIYNIIGSGCYLDDKDSDGVVYVEDAKLGYGEEYIINGSCKDVLKTDLHSNLLNPNKYPQTLDLILNILNE
ncbi:MAG: alpha/beta fold hydrolase [Candidatus Woesearchaeota archaeon]